MRENTVETMRIIVSTDFNGLLNFINKFNIVKIIIAAKIIFRDIFGVEIIQTRNEIEDIAIKTIDTTTM